MVVVGGGGGGQKNMRGGVRKNMMEKKKQTLWLLNQHVVYMNVSDWYVTSESQLDTHPACSPVPRQL